MPETDPVPMLDSQFDDAERVVAGIPKDVRNAVGIFAADRLDGAPTSVLGTVAAMREAKSWAEGFPVEKSIRFLQHESEARAAVFGATAFVREQVWAKQGADPELEWVAWHVGPNDPRDAYETKHRYAAVLHETIRRMDATRGIRRKRAVARFVQKHADGFVGGLMSGLVALTVAWAAGLLRGCG